MLIASIRSRRWAALASAVLVGVTAGLIYRAIPGGRAPMPLDDRIVPAEGRDLLAIFDPAEPLMVPGDRMSLAEAGASVGYPLYTPQALPENIAGTTPEVWISKEAGEVGLRYGSELVLTFRTWPPGEDPAKHYAQQAIDWAAGTATKIAGNPAWVIPPNAQGPDAPPASVIHISLDQVEVTLYAKMRIEALGDIAASLKRA